MRKLRLFRFVPRKRACIASVHAEEATRARLCSAPPPGVLLVVCAFVSSSSSFFPYAKFTDLY